MSPDVPATYWAVGGVSAGMIVGAFLLVGGHHEVVYRWRQRRRARNLFIDLTQKRERWH